MPTRESELRDKTHKEKGLDIRPRVFYTLQDCSSPDATKKAFSLLVALLHRSGHVSVTQIDDLLLEVVR